MLVSELAPSFELDDKLPAGKGIQRPNGWHSLSPELWVVMLMATSKGKKFEHEPNLAVFDQHGFTERAVWICGKYATYCAHNNIDRLFAPLLEKYRNDTESFSLELPKSMKDYMEATKDIPQLINDSVGIAHDMLGKSIRANGKV